MFRMILAFCALLAASTQAMQLVSTTPVHGAAGVPTSTQLVLQFDSPIDPEALYHQELGDSSLTLPVQFMVAEPWQAISVLSFQLENANTAFRLDLALQPDTDYTFVLSAAIALDGSGLLEPRLVFFSTAADPGPRQVSGVIEFSGVAANTVVALMDGPLSGSESRFLNGCLASPAGQFLFPWVRPGVYYPVAALDLDLNGLIEPGPGGDPLGFLDPDGDGLQDSIVVGAQDLDGLSLTLLHDLPRRTAREAVAMAWSGAQAWNPLAELKAITGWDEPDDRGATQSWACVYTAPGQEVVRVEVVGPFGVEGFQMTDVEGLAGEPPVPADFIDSDLVHSTALEQGGADFLAGHGSQVQHTLAGGAQSALWPQDPLRRLWTYEFLHEDGENSDLLLVMMDMVTGEVLHTTVVEPGPAIPEGLELAHNTPNPFNPDTILRFHLPTAGRTRLAVYDILGREVAVVLKGAYPAGEHHVRFDGSALAAGLYFVTLEFDGARLTRSMTLLK